MCSKMIPAHVFENEPNSVFKNEPNSVFENDPPPAWKESIGSKMGGEFTSHK